MIGSASVGLIRTTAWLLIPVNRTELRYSRNKNCPKNLVSDEKSLKVD